MSIVDTIKDMLVPDNEPGVELKCAECGETFDEPRDRCPNCGSEDLRETEAFDMRPDT